MDILCHPENNDRGQWLSNRKTNTQAKTWGKRSEHWFTGPHWTMNLDKEWHWIVGEELDWFVAATSIRKTGCRPILFPHHLQRVIWALSFKWAQRRLGRAWNLFGNRRWALGAEPLGERAWLCMQDMASPLPGVRTAPAVVSDHALSHLLPGREGSGVSSRLDAGEDTDH